MAWGKGLPHHRLRGALNGPSEPVNHEMNEHCLHTYPNINYALCCWCPEITHAFRKKKSKNHGPKVIEWPSHAVVLNTPTECKRKEET